MVTTTRKEDFLGRNLTNATPGTSQATDFLGRNVVTGNKDFAGQVIDLRPARHHHRLHGGDGGLPGGWCGVDGDGGRHIGWFGAVGAGGGRHRGGRHRDLAAHRIAWLNSRPRM